MSAQERIYTLIVKGQRIPVTPAVYTAYYQEYEHERYLQKKSTAHEYSLEQLVEAGVSLEFRYAQSLTSVEDEIMIAEQMQELYGRLARLQLEEQAILIGIFFYGRSAKQLAMQLGVSASAVDYRKQKALQKLKLALTKSRM